MLIREPLPLYQEDSAALRELPADLLARAAFLGAADGAIASPDTTPENPGVFSFQGTLRSSTGYKLPEVAKVMEQRDRWRESASPLGFLAANTEVSTTTGCWSVIDAWRDDKGYILVRDPSPYGLERDSRYGTRSHKLALILHKRVEYPDFSMPPDTDIDHLCRFTGCCNPEHEELVSKKENNLRQRLAHPIESALALGQLMMGPTGYDWLDRQAALAKDKDTGIIINTRFGPFRITKLDDDPLIIRGQPEPDNLLPQLRPPSVRKAPRPSRAKTLKPLKGQRVLFPKSKYVKHKVPTKSDLYNKVINPV